MVLVILNEEHNKKIVFFDFPVLRLYYVSVRLEAGERVSA
jgi:hypothetical protein